MRSLAACFPSPCSPFWSMPLPIACEVQPADVAAPKLGSDCEPLAGWLSTHERFVVIANKNRAQVVFLGDSITAHWRTRFKEHFLQEFGQYKAANFGIGGDRSQHVLWRVENALFEASTPKVVVLMIGTNNAKTNPPLRSCIRDPQHHRCHSRTVPTTKVLLQAILPRGGAKAAANNAEVNAEIATSESRVSLVNPSGSSCGRTDSLLGDDLFWPRFAPLRSTLRHDVRPRGAVGLRTDLRRMA
jgi:hypothetical protein